MTDRPVRTDPPTPDGPDRDPRPREGTASRWHGWRVLGGGKIERRLELKDPETGELFLQLLERMARLSGVPSEIRIRSGEVRIHGERSEAGGVGPLSLSLHLELDRDLAADP